MTRGFEPGLLVRERIRGLQPYQPAHYPDAVKLDANENPFDFPPEVSRAIAEMLRPQTFNRYPDEMAVELVRELAAVHGVAAEQIMAGNGSDELILDLMLAFGAGNRVVIAVPTFSMYAIHARIAGAEIIEIPRRDDFSLDAEMIVQAASGAGLVVLCSPNNPTGNSLELEQLSFILAGCSCPVVVDQAYVEFGGTDSLDLFNQYENLVVLRTFSKAFGLAGLRVGYLLAHPEVLYYLLKVKQPYNLNSFSQIAALCVLRHRDIFMQQVAQINAQRQRLYMELQQIEAVNVYPSDANFLLFRTIFPADDVFGGLIAHNILVRNFGDPVLSEYLRVSIGLPSENDNFLIALRQVIGGLKEKKS